MIRTRLLVVLSAFALLASGSAGAVTVFAPTDNDVNFFSYSIVLPSTSTIVAIFDDSDTTYTGSYLSLALPDLVTFSAGGINPVDYTATNKLANTLNLTGSNWFIMAISHDGGQTWFADKSSQVAGPNAYDVTFRDGSVLTVDVRVVPVPAAVWLFGSGLLGLVGVARRKRAA